MGPRPRATRQLLEPCLDRVEPSIEIVRLNDADDSPAVSALQKITLETQTRNCGFHHLERRVPAFDACGRCHLFLSHSETRDDDRGRPSETGRPHRNISRPLVRVVRGSGAERRPESSGLPHEASVHWIDEPQRPTRRPPRSYRVNSWRPLNGPMELARGLASAKPAGLDPHRVLTKGALDSPIRGNFCLVGSPTVSAIPVSKDGIHNARFLAEGRRRAARYEEGEPSEGFRRKNSITREKGRFPRWGSDLHYILQRPPSFSRPPDFRSARKSPERTEEGRRPREREQAPSLADQAAVRVAAREVSQRGGGARRGSVSARGIRRAVEASGRAERRCAKGADPE